MERDVCCADESCFQTYNNTLDHTSNGRHQKKLHPNLKEI